MITLVCGVRQEAPTLLLIKALKELQADFLVFNQEELSNHVQTRWQYNNKGIKGTIRIKDEYLNIKDISGVFLRFMSTKHMPDAKKNEATLTKTRSVITSLTYLFDILPIKVINPKYGMMTNFSKPNQSLMIRKSMFKIPETLITNKPALAVRFIEHSDFNVIYKSISSERSIVKKVKKSDIDKIDHITYLPTQFQRYIEGNNIRVHVVDDQIFATEVSTKTVDYRYAHVDGDNAELKPIDLPKDIKSRCIELTKRLGLVFSGIDLIRNKNDYYCLEVNTSPGYSYYELSTGQPISQALATYLTSKKKPLSKHY